MSEPVAQPVADLSQNGCDMLAVPYSNLSHPRVGLHLSQTRRTGGVEQVTEPHVADPADAYPTKASIKAAFDAWQAAGEPWPPPAGLTSAIASHLIPRPKTTPWSARKWR